MAALNPPWALASPAAHTQDHMRRLIRAMNPVPGVVAATDLLVSALGTPNMTVNVAAGFVFMPATEQAAGGGGPAAYAAYNDATVNLSIAAADPTNPRRDLVVAKVQDTQYSGATNAWSLAVVTGTPAASPADPATPNNSITLARIAVAANASSIAAGVITDLRPRSSALGGTIFCTSTTRPGTAGPYVSITPTAGMSIFELDTSKAMTYYSATTGWQPSDWNSAWGEVASATLGTNSAALTTYTTILSASWVAVANRKYRITIQGILNTDATTNYSFFGIDVDGTTYFNDQTLLGPSSQVGKCVVARITGLAAGTRTANMKTGRNAGTTTVATPALLLVEDIGPNGNPV